MTAQPDVAGGFTATEKQAELMRLVTDGRYSVIGFGGAIRSSKTWGTLSVVIGLARIFPGSRWAVIRHNLELLRQTTIPSFNKLRPLAGGFVGPVNGQTFEADCANGSQILFRGEQIDRDPELERFSGYEVNGFILEEADELAERTFYKAIERAGAWIVPNGGQQPAPLVLATFNPNDAWPKEVFYDPWVAGTLAPPFAFLPATIDDNPYADEAYRSSLKLLPPDEYRRRVMGDWSSIRGRFYPGLSRATHYRSRSELPDVLPDWWEYWGGYDWGFGHWAVFVPFARDPDGVTYVLPSVWMRGEQDDQQANTIKAAVPAACLDEVYAGHDCWAQVKARGGSGISTAEVFEESGINLLQADTDRVNGGRAVNRALSVSNGRPRLIIVESEGNERIFSQLMSALPDPNNREKPAKVDADQNGKGGDDGRDALTYGLATRMDTPADLTDERETLAKRKALDSLSRREAERADKMDKAADRELERIKRLARLSVSRF